jgi:Tfp pilus assembly PilM family ATPase
MPAAGLSVNDEGVRFVHISDIDGAAKVESFGSADFPAGAVVNGEIRDEAAVANAFAALKKQYGLRFVRAAISDDAVYLFRLNLPLISESDVRSAIEFKLEENVPIPAGDAIFDYSIANRNDVLGTTEAVVAAVASKTSESYLDTMKSAGLSPLRLNLESQAIAHAVVPKAERGTVLVAHFAHTKTLLFLVQGGMVQFSFTLPVEERADPAGAQSPQKYQKLVLVREGIERIVNYWKDTMPLPAGESFSFKVIASGGEALDAEFVSKFASLAGQPVEVADPWQNVFDSNDAAPPIPKEDSFRYAAAIGVALANCPRLNFHV